MVKVAPVRDYWELLYPWMHVGSQTFIHSDDTFDTVYQVQRYASFVPPP